MRGLAVSAWSAATSGVPAWMAAVWDRRWRTDRADGEADHDSLRKIAEDGEQERRQQDDRISPRTAQQHELMVLRHVPGDDCEHGGEGRQRDVGRKRRRHQHEQQQENRVQHAGDGAARAGPNVGGSARDRAGDADAAKQCRADVGDALRHELAVRAMPAPGHAIGHHRRQKRFDRTQQRKRDRIRQNRLDFRERYIGQAEEGWCVECRRTLSRLFPPARPGPPQAMPPSRPQ